jgi:hypothetical protein
MDPRNLFWTIRSVALSVSEALKSNLSFTADETIREPKRMDVLNEKVIFRDLHPAN